ncbi:hypothetical protein AO369_0169 [Moraxella catarrhalis]|nr:hypothetical protein AO369_0169 [Moraxella catarrhalis]
MVAVAEPAVTDIPTELAKLHHHQPLPPTKQSPALPPRQQLNPLLYNPSFLGQA